MKSIKKQQGINLVSLMISLVISSVILLATFTIFQRITKTSIDVTNKSSYEGNVAMLLIMLQQEVQNAGFKMNNNNDQLIIENLGGLTQIYWRFSDQGGSPYTCVGLEEKLITDPKGNSSIEVYFVEPSDECTKDGSLKAMKWDEYVQKVILLEERATTIFNTVDITTEECSAYMVGDNTIKHKVLNVSIFSNNENFTHDMSICLMNL